MAVDRPINYDGTEPQQSVPVDIEVQTQVMQILK